MKKLILGTAQFGLQYGITNPKLSISKNSVFEILTNAINSEINYFDTAFSYGNSIEVIGECFKALKVNPKIINKVQNFESSESAKKTYSDIETSLAVLGVSNYYALLLHDPKSLKDSQVWALLRKLKEEGKVEKIGASIYSIDDLNSCPYIQEIDILQFPINILSNHKDCLSALQKKFPQGLPEVHARSIFLQGLLLQNASTWPQIVPEWNSFSQIEDYLSSLREEATCDLLELCTRYIKSIEWIEGVVFGVYDLIQLKEVLEAFHKKQFGTEVIEAFDNKKPFIDPRICDPREWVSSI